MKQPLTYVEQIYTSCLAQGSYFVISGDEAIVVDPMREAEPYIERAAAYGVKIKYILETHFHADFVSGHLDLAQKSGATIVYGPGAVTEFEKYEAKDDELLAFGNFTIKVVHTPGHTMESTCYLLKDENGRDACLFTGDTLFIGDVGRPDLAQQSSGVTAEDQAGILYDSLRNKIMPLADDVIIFPAHGAGSSCGKNMSSHTWSTLGEQKESNYALHPKLTRSQFVQELTNELQAPPQYFSKNAALNKIGYEPLSEILDNSSKALDVAAFKALIQDDILILDVRDKLSYCASHIPGSIFIGLDGSFAPWVGTLVEDLDQKILLVAPEGREEEAVIRLARVGYNGVIGWLNGGLVSWIKAEEATSTIPVVQVERLASQVEDAQDFKIIDVRRPAEFKASHIEGAFNRPLDFLLENKTALPDPMVTKLVHCRSGYRSTVACSIWKSRGETDLVNIIGAFPDVKNTMDFVNSVKLGADS